MRRADRLFRIIQLLRGRRRAVTASWLAEQLDVSERTVYRDIRDLIASGTPIDGEAGVGYSIRRDYDLPPLMFDPGELEALAFGTRLVAAFGDEPLARSAASAISKVEAVLPKSVPRATLRPPLFAPQTPFVRAQADVLDAVRMALAARRKLALEYEKADGERSERVVRPLGAFFWGKSWTLTAWCELRNDFRNFRLDRIAELNLQDVTFEDEPGHTLRDFLRRIGPGAESLLDD